MPGMLGVLRRRLRLRSARSKCKVRRSLARLLRMIRHRTLALRRLQDRRSVLKIGIRWWARRLVMRQLLRHLWKLRRRCRTWDQRLRRHLVLRLRLVAFWDPVEGNADDGGSVFNRAEIVDLNISDADFGYHGVSVRVIVGLGGALARGIRLIVCWTITSGRGLPLDRETSLRRGFLREVRRLRRLQRGLRLILDVFDDGEALRRLNVWHRLRRVGVLDRLRRWLMDDGLRRLSLLDRPSCRVILLLHLHDGIADRLRSRPLQYGAPLAG